MGSKFLLGQLVATAAVAQQMKEEPTFADFVRRCISRYIACDWGDLCASDKQQNDDAVKNSDDRILAAYENPEHPDWKLWIITEWDHSATTVLFPSDY